MSSLVVNGKFYLSRSFLCPAVYNPCGILFNYVCVCAVERENKAVNKCRMVNTCSICWHCCQFASCCSFRRCPQVTTIERAESLRSALFRRRSESVLLCERNNSFVLIWSSSAGFLWKCCTFFFDGQCQFSEIFSFNLLHR
jgi:hypothetical protein